MAVSQLGYIGIGVSDMAAWEKFATEILGLQLAERAPDGTVYLRMDEYCYRIILHPSGEDDILYVGLLAQGEEEYLSTLASLEGAGVELTKPANEELAARRVKDMLQFNVSNIPFEIAFGAAVEFRHRFVPGRPMSGFTAGRLGLGHVVLALEDPQAAITVLKAAGFRVTDYAGPAVFLRCNARHHSVAAAPARLFAMQGMTKKLNHVMLETRELDDVGRAIDLATEGGYPIPSAIGKHNNDHMVSFYLQTPSGFEIEYGWAGRLIDEETWQVVHYPGDDVWGHGRPAWGGKSQPPRPPMPPGTGMPPGAPMPPTP